MPLPKFLLADNTDYPNSIFIIHTEYPALIVDLSSDEVMFLEDVNDNDFENMEIFISQMIKEAEAFYDKEITKYKEENGGVN